MKHHNTTGTSAFVQCRIWPRDNIPGYDQTRAKLEAELSVLRVKGSTKGDLKRSPITLPDDAAGKHMEETTGAVGGNSDSDPLVLFEQLAE